MAKKEEALALRDGKPKHGTTRIVSLDINKDNGSGPRAQVMLIGDAHIGSPQCDEVLLKHNIDLCLEKNIYVILMGDIVECATRNSVGAGVYEQYGTIDDQIDRAVEFFIPLVKPGLLLGSIAGNHEARGYKDIGHNPTKNMCRLLQIPYLGPNKHFIMKVGKQTYTLYVTHGSSGATTIGGKINCLMRVAKNTTAEIVAHAHVHELLSITFLHFDFVHNKKRFGSVPRYGILTGHFLRYGGYGQEKDFQPTRCGSPLLILWADRHEIRVMT